MGQFNYKNFRGNTFKTDANINGNVLNWAKEDNELAFVCLPEITGSDTAQRQTIVNR